MKRLSRILGTLALLVMTLGIVPAADAALNSFSPTAARLVATPIGGMPSWYQDQNGVSVEPCLLPLATCGLIGLGDPFFNEALALAFPGNFPIEAFYFNATTNDLTVAGHVIFIIDALEFTFIDPITGAIPAAPPMPAGALSAPFQRLRFVIAPPAGASITLGNWKIDSPWGTATFDTSTCRNPAARCRLTRDLPVPGAIPPSFAAALGTGVADSISTFLHDPAAPAGFLGAAAAAASVTGGALRNSFIVTDPLGNTGTISTYKIIAGKKVGMELVPGNHIDHGGVNIVPLAGFVAVPQTVTVTNTLTANSITFPALVAAGVDAADFVITSPPAAGGAGCSGATVAPLGICAFDVTFTPTALPKAARAATITLAPTTVQVAGAVAVDDPPPIPVNLIGTATVTVNVAAGPNGAATPATQTVGAGTAATFTAAPAGKQFKVKDVTEGATLIAPAAADPTSFTIANVGAANHAITANFMPSGDLDANGTLDIADAQKALKIVAGIQAAAGTDKPAMIVAPLDPATKIPAPAAGRAEPDIGDVLLILRRVVGLDTW
jgi:hypothetical protein